MDVDFNRSDIVFLKMCNVMYLEVPRRLAFVIVLGCNRRKDFVAFRLGRYFDISPK